MLFRLQSLFFALLCCVLVYSEDISYSDLIGMCQTEQVEALCEGRDIFRWNEETLFESIQGGLSRAALYSFKKDGKKYVLRFLGLHHSKQMRENELEALRIASDLGIASPPVFVDKNSIFMVIPFIEGTPLIKPNSSQLLQLGKMVRLLHGFSGLYPTKYTFRERLRRHYQKGIETGVAYPTGFKQKVEKVLQTSPSRRLVPSHGDLNPSNILASNDHMSIIDWTTGTWDDPFADLSYFSALSNLSSFQEEILLEGYFGRKPSSKEHHILKEGKRNVYLLTAAIWLRFSETLEERTAPLERRTAHLDAQLYSPCLKTAQDYLKEGIVVDLKTAPKSEIKSYALSFYKAHLEASTSTP